MYILGCLDKEIQKESRAVYWSNVRFDIGNTFVDDSKDLSVHYFGVLEYFLRGLGDEGRFAIKQLVVKDTSAP